jgi:Fe-Mn family superoxide dismutase
MDYIKKNFESLLGLSGFSENLLTNHFRLYEGYVKNTNNLLEILEKTDQTSPLYTYLKHRFAWEFNGMRLHELYFENIEKTPKTIDSFPLFYEEINRQFGSFSHWEKDFRSTGSLRGIGWTLLVFDPASHRLFNIWVNEHDGGHLLNTVPLLVMDVFEHAFMLDYGIDRSKYIESFFQQISWEKVSNRFKEISSILGIPV